MNQLGDLLQKTSRTFALAIPMLPEPTRQEVSVAYLLFRIVDTFEDATLWPPEVRIAALEEFAEVLESCDEGRARRLQERCARDRPLEHPGYLELLDAIPLVVQAYQALGAPSREVLKLGVLRTARGMAKFAGRMDGSGGLALQSMQDLRNYCYLVAGVVGEMLTELFLLQAPRLAPSAAYLRDRSCQFGEGLQLVNILKDARSDSREGRVYLPAAVEIGSVFTLARQDMQRAGEYAAALQNGGADVGVFRFTSLLVRLAQATLVALESTGAGAKLSRDEVMAIAAQVALDSGS